MLCAGVVLTKDAPTFLELFLVDFAPSEPLLQNIERCPDLRLMVRAAVTWTAKPAHQEHDHDHRHGDEHDHHERAEEPAVPPAIPHVRPVARPLRLLR
jgi:ABC-type Zn2+ transport system substrate-binding protein/surface adhesin